MGHTFSALYVHIIFSTEKRRNLLYRNMRPRLVAYMGSVAVQQGARVIRIVAVDNHVHMLIEVKAAHSISDLIKKVKSNSSRWIHATFPNLRDFAWQSGFSAIFCKSFRG